LTANTCPKTLRSPREERSEPCAEVLFTMLSLLDPG
jgi:hypothetical protein